MQVNLANFNEIHRPIYVLEEERLRHNLSLIRSVAERADMEIILAFKAYALWKTFPIFREYISSTTASSLARQNWRIMNLAVRRILFAGLYRL